MRKIYITSITLFFLMNKILAQDTVPLYPDKIPNSKATTGKEKTEQHEGHIHISNISVPTIRYFPAPENNDSATAVIIFPGGSYLSNSFSHEGTDVAKRFNEIGVTAFVVKYRLPSDDTMLEKEIGPLQDAQQAIKIVREQAAKYKINPQSIGILGFSAGGHLASTAGTHFKQSKISNEKNTNLRPDFMILIYPVISFQNDIAHTISRGNLIGKQPAKEMIDLYSNELQVTNETPPTFLVHASDDSGVPVAHSLRFYESLINHKVQAELHIYQRGEHGFGLTNKTTKDDWFERCKNWMDANGWLHK